MRSFDQRDFAPVAQSPRGDIFPVLPPIAGEVNQSRVASRPDQIAVKSRWRNREHDPIPGTFRVLDSWLTRRFLISFIFRIALMMRIMSRSGEIGTTGLPGQTAIPSLHPILPSDIMRRRV